MTPRHDDDGLAAVALKLAAIVAAWLGSWTLGEVQQALGIVTGLVVLGYTIDQWRTLRRKNKGRR